MRRIAITGGIGSGKSVVSSILRVIGFSVYDCDSQAKRIMNSSASLKDELRKAFGNNAVVGDIVNKAYISKIVFNNQEALAKLNSIVHPFVRQDYEAWSNTKGVSFVETAILFESGMDKLVDEIWIVNAPEDIRVKRVMNRNGLSKEDVLARINSQVSLDRIYDKECVSIIVNDDKASVLNQIMNLVRGMQR